MLILPMLPVFQILSSASMIEKLQSSISEIRTAEVLRLRATSSVSGEQSVRRSAQDGEFVGRLRKNILNE